MSDTQFFQTALGRQFYERTMPKLAEELARLNQQLDQLVQLLREREAREARSPEA